MSKSKVRTKDDITEHKAKLEAKLNELIQSVEEARRDRNATREHLAEYEKLN